MWKVYRFTFPNGKVYIGCTKMQLTHRCRPSGYSTQKVHEAFTEFGRDYKLEVLSEWATMEEGHAAEIDEIAKHNSTNPEKGYNVTQGGYGALGVPHTEEWKKANSERMKGRKMSEGTRAKMHELFVGKPRPDLAEDKNGFYGKKHNAEVLKRISEVGRTKKFTDEIRKHMSEGHKGISHTAVICVETGKQYRTLQEASKDTGINYSCISAVARGRGYTAGGFHWQLAEAI